MSSDMYSCGRCGKYQHELDMYRIDGWFLCKGCACTGTEDIKLDTISMPERGSAKLNCERTTMSEICGCATAHDRHLENGIWMCDNCNRIAMQPFDRLSPCPDNSHYAKLKMQPWDYIIANGLNFFEGNVVKYVTRWRHKNGLDDLRKARVYIDELIRQEEAK